MAHSRPRGWIHDWEPEGRGSKDPRPLPEKAAPHQGAGSGAPHGAGFDADAAGFGSPQDAGFDAHGAGEGTSRRPHACGGPSSDPHHPSSPLSGAYGERQIDPALRQAPRAHTMTQSARAAARIVDKPGQLLVKLSAITSSACFLLGLLGRVQFGGWGWWIPLVFGGLGLVGALFFTWRRRVLLNALEVSGPRNVVATSFDAGGNIIGEDVPGAGKFSAGTFDADSKDRAAYARERAQEAGEAYARARGEYHTRTARFFPRVEAATRALRSSVEPGYHAAWLQHDFRPTLVAFFAVALSIPVCAFLAFLTAFALLLQALA